MTMRLVLLCGLLAGCAYDPPIKADHAAPKYQADLAKCSKQVNNAASARANATVGKAIRSMFNSNEPQHHDIGVCMQGKGYVL